MTSACEEVARSISASVRAQLAADLERAEEEETAERSACADALMRLLVSHRPPESSVVLRVQLRDTGRYDAWLEGSYPVLGLTWRCDVFFPEGHPFNQALRVDHLQQRLDVHAPELTGGIKKEVQVRPQHLERHTIVEVDARDSQIVLRLRAEAGAAVGFDLECDTEAGRVAASRIGEDPSAGPFDIEETDAPKLVALCESVQKRLTEARSERLSEAKLGDADFQSLPAFTGFVERFIEQLAPVVHEIARHSLEPDELVLRWRLADDRREEIFVSKTTLREKYEHLPDALRELFHPLALHVALSRSIAPLGGSPSSDGTVRSELSPSRPPPPPSFSARDVEPPVASAPFVVANAAVSDAPELEWDEAAGEIVSK
jgi:hypothetical protein